jgi:membrane protein
MSLSETSTNQAGAAGRGGLSYLKQTASEWMNDNAMRLSAALSLYTILSLAPLLVIMIKVIGLLWRNSDTARVIFLKQLTSLMGSDAASKAMEPMLSNSGKHGNGLLASVISFAVLIFSATGVFIELQNSMNAIWDVKPKPNQGLRGFVRNRLLSAGMVFGIAFLLLVSMFISTTLGAIAKDLAGGTKWFGFIFDVIVSFGVISLLFAGIFKFLPDAKVQWKHVWLGAILTAGLFTIGKYGLALYFKYGTPTSAFGAAGSLAAILLWVYYSSFILFFGAEFTKVWATAHGHAIVPDEHAVKAGEQAGG